MDEVQNVLIQAYGSAYLIFCLNWRTQETWFEVDCVTQKTKHKTFAEAVKVMREVMKK